MSVQAAVSSQNQHTTRGTDANKPKKRKHQASEEHNTERKKRKHVKEHADVDDGLEDEQSTERIRKKKSNKKHRDSPEVEERGNLNNGVPTTDHSRRESSEQKKKRKKKRDKEPALEAKLNGNVSSEDGETELSEGKKKKQRSKEEKKQKRSKKSKQPREPTPEEEVLTNGNVTEDDLELPDAPQLEDESSEAGAMTAPDGQLSTAEAAGTSRTEYPFGEDFLDTADPSCFYSTRLSLQLPIPAVSLKTARNSILSMHLAPLLLTYYPPAKGIILAFSDPVLSAKPEFGINLPLRPPTDGTIPETIPDEVLSRAADDFGACWVWLTVTFLVFRPEQGSNLHGWTNVVSQGFVGLLSYNYFQIAVGKPRIPEQWKWNGPTREHEKKKRSRKGRLRDDETADWNDQSSTVREDYEEATHDERPMESHVSDGSGFFVDSSWEKMPDTFEVRVVDIEMVPEKDRWTLHIDGTLLGEEAEQAVLAEERRRFERLANRERSVTPRPDVEMSGGLAESREGSLLGDED